MPESTSPKHRVLVIDDSPQITGLLATALDDLAIITVAHSGDDALQQALALKPHVMLVDIILPGLSGFDVVETLRQRPGGLTAQVIFMTGLQEPANAYRARELGAMAVLYKPLVPEHVRRVVLQALGVV